MNLEIRLGDILVLFALLGLFIGGLWWWGDYQQVVRDEVKKWGFNEVIAKCCVCPPWVEKTNFSVWGNKNESN